MENYLSFELSAADAKDSTFAHYTLGNSGLLPHYFGDIARINIFLGENNAGKSRFMREIMKCAPTRMFTLSSSIKVTEEYIEEALRVSNTIETDELYKIELSVYHITQEVLNFSNYYLFTEDENRRGKAETIIEPKIIIIKIIALLNKILKSFNSTKIILDFLASNDINNTIEELEKHNKNLIRASTIYRDLWDNKKSGLNSSSYSNEVAHFSGNNTRLLLHAGRQSYDITYRHGLLESFGKRAYMQISKFTREVEFAIESLESINNPVTLNPDRTYIPTLRTARTFVDRQGQKVPALEDVLLYTTNNDYKLKDSNVTINTGLSLFNAIDEMRNADISDREKFKQFEDFLSETFFNGKKVEVVPNRRNTTILVAVDREERELPYLGDGIQAIILLLYPLFIAKQGAWFFIEEPETHLHPGFQRLFVKTIATHEVLLAKKLTIFLTTHSNHILDFALSEAQNINLFTFRKSREKENRNSYQLQLTAPRDLDCLTTLGVQNSSVFLSNCTIWVEGISDRIYLKAYLDAYLKYLQLTTRQHQTFSLLEGLHYSFLEYAGANVAHYTFGAMPQKIQITEEALKNIQALSISNRIMLIADRDAGKDAKHENLSSQQHTGFVYIVLPTREIENLLSPEVIVAALSKLYPKQSFAVSSLKADKYQDVYLGSYLRSRFPELRETFIAKSGTISSAKKRDFAEAAATAIASWEMLSDDAKALTKQVFNFIKAHNPGLGSN